MSAISEKVRKAIYAKCTPPASTAVIGTGKLTGIYEGKAPNEAVLPYGIFQRFSAGEVKYTFGVTLALEDDIWLLKVLADESSSTTKEPQEFAEDMLATWLTTLGNTLTIAGNTVAWLARHADMPPFEEQKDERFIYHRGALIRVKTE